MRLRILLAILFALTAVLILPAAANAAVVVGQVVSTTNGGWSNNPTIFAYQWEDCDSSGNNCVFIAGATSQSYTVLSGDIGHTLRVIITASNATGSGSRTAGQTVVVTSGGSSPANTVAPVESGTATQGSVLSTTTGTWTGSPTFAYQWQRCDAEPSCADITGATSSTYTLAAADVNFTARAVVTGTAGGSSATAASNQSDVVTASGGVGTWNGTQETGSTTTVCSKYAATTGNDSTGTGTIGAPYLTAQKLSNNLTSGQVGCLRAGTYDVGLWTISQAGTSVTAYPGEAVVVKGAPEVVANGVSLSYLNIGLNYLVTVPTTYCGNGLAPESVLIEANNVTFTHNAVYNDPTIPSNEQYDAGVGVGFDVHAFSPTAGYSGIDISYNRVHHIGCFSASGSPHGRGHTIYVANAHNVAVHHNWLYDVYGGGIQFYDSCSAAGCSGVSPPEDGPHDDTAYSNVIDHAGEGFFIWANNSLFRNIATTHNVITNTTEYAGYAANAFPDSSNTFTNSDGFATSTTWPCTSCGTGMTTSGLLNVDPQYATPYTGSIGSSTNTPDYRVSGSSPVATWGLWTGDFGSTSTAQLGNTNAGSLTGVLSADFKRGSCFTAGASGTLKSLVLHLAPNTPGTQAITGVVYSSSGGLPGSLLGFTTELTYRSTPSGWYRLPLTADISVASGTTYCLGALSGQTSAVGLYQGDDIGGASYANANTYTNGPSNPYSISGSITTQTPTMSIYATIQ